MAVQYITRAHANAARKEKQMLKKMIGYVKDEQGVETLEWIAVGAAIVALALLVYPGTLANGINSVITNIVTDLTAL